MFLVADFASALQAVDARRPQWRTYAPGIGAHDEREVVRRVLAEMVVAHADRYSASAIEVPYPEGDGLRCDLCLGDAPWEVAVEVKMHRMLHSKGTVDDTAIKDLLSPYPEQHSAVTDCGKLARSAFACAKVMLIYAFDYPTWPMEPAVAAFEVLARRRCGLGERMTAPFDGLVHPYHQRGAVFGWTVHPLNGET